MPVDYNQIGITNMALVSALKAGDTHAAGYAVTEYLHAKGYNYDLSYGTYGIANKKSLSGTYVGTKYYCYSKGNVDMAKRIVHIHDPVNPGNAETFYRLIHTSAAPGLNDNSYQSCELITNIP